MTLLLLAGSGQARLIAQALSGQKVIASLAGATRAPRHLAVPTRSGGFGGEAGFESFLEAEQITAVLDATHPFASRISHRTARICKARSIPYCQYLRPPWVAEAGDDWHMVDDESQVAQLVTAGDVVFMATGRQTLHRYENLSHCTLICRQIDPSDAKFPFPNGRFLIGRPPFSVEQELALFKELRVDWLVVKNAGGAAPMSKLEAARMLNIPVAMINRPEQPDAPQVATVAAAIDWAKSQVELA